MFLARPARHFAAQKCDRFLFGRADGAAVSAAGWRAGRGDESPRLIANIAHSRRSRSVEGHELLEGVLNLLHLDGLGEDDEPVVGGRRSRRASCLWPSKTRATS